MASKWTVAPEPVRIDLEWNGEPFWIEIKKDLNEGERRRSATAGFRGMTVQGGDRNADKPQEITIDWASQSLARTLAYLLDWNLLDDKGNKLPVKRDSIEALHPDVYDVIEKGINAHVEQRAAEKKSTAAAGAAKPSLTSV